MPSGLTYNHEILPLDCQDFSDCEFRDVRLTYSGGEPPSFSRCSFTNCEWKLDDGAARTLGHLKLIWSLGGKQSVQTLIKEITGAPR